VVASPSFQDIVDAACPNPPPTGPSCPSTPTIIRDATNNQLVTVFSNYENLAQRRTKGVDLDFSISQPTPLGKLTVSGDATYVARFDEDGVGYAGSNGGSNTIPRWRASLSADLDTGPWALTARVNHTHHVTQEAAAGSFFVPQDPRFQNGVLPNAVDSHSTLDLFARYQVTKKLSLSASILNVFDKTPPYDPGFSSTSLYDFSLHDIRGRQFRFTMKYVM
jgi:iron complex outermembrane recepter protein